jgi:Polyketide cyclase / dehydrase and lipid transport
LGAVRTWTATSTGSPAAAWPLLARPARWPEWAPHLGGAWGLGSPEVCTGAVGAARLFGAVPVPARIVAKRAGRSWTWRVGLGLVEMVHRVEPLEGGCVVAIDLNAPSALERTLALAYGPVIQGTLNRLARKAAAA